MQVAWLDQNSIPLTYEERRVIDDPRFSVVRRLVRDWNLQLQDVRLDDAGVYRCTVNTKQIATKVVSLLVTGQHCAVKRNCFFARLLIVFIFVCASLLVTRICCDETAISSWCLLRTGELASTAPDCLRRDRNPRNEEYLSQYYLFS